MYSVVTDVRNALTPGGATDDRTTAASLSDAQLVDAVKQADGMIDAHLSTRYTIPQDEDNPLVAVDPIRWWSRDIAAYLATLTFKRNKDVPQDDPIRLRFNLAMSTLIAVRDGKANLDLPPVGGEGTDITVVNLYEGRLFGPEDFGLSPAGRPMHGIWPGGY